jgi:hypothetical protein
MTEPLDLEPIKALIDEAKQTGVYFISYPNDLETLEALIAEVERLREEMRQVKIDFHWATG